MIGRKNILLVAIFVLACPVFQMPIAPAGNAAALTGSPSPYKWVDGLWTINCGDSGSWDDTDLYSACTIQDGGIYKVFYCGVNATGITRSGLAYSSARTYWNKSAANPILSTGNSSAWDSKMAAVSCVLKENSTYRMWYVGGNGTGSGIGYANSTDGTNWTKHASNPVLSNGTSGSWDQTSLSSAWVINDNGTYKMWYTGSSGSTHKIGYASSSDGLSWSKYASNPVVSTGASGWDKTAAAFPTVIRAGEEYRMWYSGEEDLNWTTGYANSSDGLSWSGYSHNPVLRRPDYHQESDQYHPAVLYNGTGYIMWFTSTYHQPFIMSMEGLNKLPTASGSSPTWWSFSSDTTPDFKWSFRDDDQWDKQTAFQIQAAWDVNFTSIFWDTGKINSSTSAYTPTDGLPEGIIYWHVRVWDTDNDAGPWSRYEVFGIDLTPPNLPVSARCTTHTKGQWYTNAKMSFEFSPAIDNVSGLFGYSVEINNISDYLPDKGRELKATAENYTDWAREEGDIYLHLRPVDNAWNGADPPLRLGPYWIDYTYPTVPEPSSSSHSQGTDIWSNVSKVKLNWTVSVDTVSGLARYVVSYRSLWQTSGLVSKEINTSETCTTVTLPDGEWMLYVRSEDVAGNVGPNYEFGPIGIDTVLPENPAVASTTHVPCAFSNLSTVKVQWSGASDDRSGLGGFSYCWDWMPDTVPDTTAEANCTVTSAQSPALGDGTVHFFHLRTADAAGNWNASTVHLGPFYIDTEVPANPVTIRSSSHQPLVWSRDSTVDVDWSLEGLSDSLSGCEGFSVGWDDQPGSLPDTTMDMGADATSSTSPRLPDGGSWYFHLRTRDRAGNWAPAASHLGPFCIDTTPPSNPNRFETAGHLIEEWDRDNTIEAGWSGASDPLSGIGGYSYLWDTLPYTVPGRTVLSGPEKTTFDSPALADGRSWYLHLLTTDRAGNWAQAAVHVGPFYIDASPPGPVLLEPHCNASCVNRTNLTLSVTATDPLPGAGVVEMRFRVDGMNWSDWEPYSKARNIALAGEGLHTISAQVRDGAGGESCVVNASVALDTMPPAVSRLLIDDGAKSTRNRWARLLVAADDGPAGTGPAGLSLRLASGGWGPWEPFTGVSIVELTGGDGQKTVSVRLRDRAGNEGPPTEGGILLDTVPPGRLALKFSQNAARTASREVGLKLEASDPAPASGLSEMAFSEDGSAWGPWEPYTPIPSYIFSPGDGVRTLFFRVRDGALNVAEPVNASIIVDTQSPLFLSAELVSAGLDNLSLIVRLDEPAMLSAGYGLASTGEAYLNLSQGPPVQYINISGLEAGRTYRFTFSARDELKNGPSYMNVSFTTAGSPLQNRPANQQTGGRNAFLADAIILASVVCMAAFIAAGAVISRRKGRR